MTTFDFHLQRLETPTLTETFDSQRLRYIIQMQTLNISEDIHYLLKKKLAFTSSSPLVNEENIFSMEHFPTVSRSSLNITVHENNTSCCQSSSRSFFQLQASKLTKR